MTNRPDFWNLPVHPALAQRPTPRARAKLRLRGFIGPSDTPEETHLHLFLNHGPYVTVPSDAIVSVDDDPTREGAVVLEVPVTAQVRVVRGGHDDPTHSEEPLRAIRPGTSTLEAGCRGLDRLIKVLEDALEDGYIEWNGVLIAFTDEQLDWIRGQLRDAKEEFDLLECWIFGL